MRKRVSQSQADISAWAIIIACILALAFLLFSSCNAPYQVRDFEPIGPYSVRDPLTQAYLIYGAAYQDDFSEDGLETVQMHHHTEDPQFSQTKHDHFWIKSAVEINDPFGNEFKEGETIWAPCICYFCKEKSICK